MIYSVAQLPSGNKGHYLEALLCDYPL